VTAEPPPKPKVEPQNAHRTESTPKQAKPEAKPTQEPKLTTKFNKAAKGDTATGKTTKGQAASQGAAEVRKLKKSLGTNPTPKQKRDVGQAISASKERASKATAKETADGKKQLSHQQRIAKKKRLAEQRLQETIAKKKQAAKDGIVADQRKKKEKLAADKKRQQYVLKDKEKKKQILLENQRAALLREAKDPRVKDAVNNLYRPRASVGDGGSAAALRHERATGELLSESGHKGKLLTRRTQLIKLWKDKSLSDSDRRIVRKLLVDAQSALGTNPDNTSAWHKVYVAGPD